MEHITITRYMIEELNLKNEELLVYATINELSHATILVPIDLNQIAQFCNTSIEQVKRCVESLVEKKMLLTATMSDTGKLVYKTNKPVPVKEID